MDWRMLKGKSSCRSVVRAQWLRPNIPPHYAHQCLRRMIRSTLEDVENRYNQQMERTTLMEQEIIEKLQLEETNQRLRDEIRGEL